MRLITVTTEEQMYDLLTALNVSGMTCELPCVHVADVGGPGRPNWAVAPFLATLTDPDADHVNYIYADEGGRSRCTIDCDNCGDVGDEWTVPYPVTALLAVEPDYQRAVEDDLDTWWHLDPCFCRAVPSVTGRGCKQVGCPERAVWDTLTPEQKARFEAVL